MTDWATQFIHSRFDMHQPLTVETVAGWLREVRAETLEEAAQTAELDECGCCTCIAAAIRALGKPAAGAGEAVQAPREGGPVG